MAHRQPTRRECVELGVAGRIMIICDDCGAAIDALRGFWLDEFGAGRVYAGRVLCPACYDKHRQEIHEEER